MTHSITVFLVVHTTIAGLASADLSVERNLLETAMMGVTVSNGVTNLLSSFWQLVK
jgi:hypothetical protein